MGFCCFQHFSYKLLPSLSIYPTFTALKRRTKSHCCFVSLFCCTENEFFFPLAVCSFLPLLPCLACFGSFFFPSFLLHVEFYCACLPFNEQWVCARWQSTLIFSSFVFFFFSFLLLLVSEQSSTVCLSENERSDNMLDAREGQTMLCEPHEHFSNFKI